MSAHCFLVNFDMQITSTYIMGKQRRIAGWILAISVAVMLVMTGIMKFIDEDIRTNFIRYGIEDWRTIIAMGEIVSALLFLFPKTNTLGTFLLSSFFGGTILVHMAHAEPFFLQTALLIITWVVFYLRHPNLQMIKN